MASTRNKNTSGNYAAEQASMLQIRQYEVYKGYRFNDQTCIPGNGLLPARLPLQMFDDNCDIESELRGIGSTNLVKPKMNTVLPPPNFGEVSSSGGYTPLPDRHMASLHITQRAPVIIPKPLVISRDQRFTF
jgi:hypothetical protein